MELINKDKNELLKELFALSRGSIKPGLERINAILEREGRPEAKYPTIHVAGTNGKGSTASIVASFLTESGLKTGLYTSPHIFEFNERIRIDGREISDDAVVELSARFLPYSTSLDATFFEITTAMAFKYFADEKVDIAVIETGMGGLSDATNVVLPIVSAITSIAFDHSDFLGATIEEIAKEKAGIIKRGVPTVASAGDADIIDIFKRTAENTGAILHLSGDEIKTVSERFLSDFTTETTLEYNGRQTTIINPLWGEGQTSNLKTAFLVSQIASDILGLNMYSFQIGLINLKKNTGLRGRMEVARTNPPIIIDVAHNPAGIKSAVDAIIARGYQKRDWTAVFGAMADKDYRAMLKELSRLCHSVYLCKPATDRSAGTDNLKAAAVEAGFESVTECGSCAEAYSLASESGCGVYAGGSFHVVEELREYV